MEISKSKVLQIVNVDMGRKFLEFMYQYKLHSSAQRVNFVEFIVVTALQTKLVMWAWPRVWLFTNCADSASANCRVMPRRSSVIRLTSISVLLLSVLWLFITYLRGGRGELDLASAGQPPDDLHVPTNRTIPRNSSLITKLHLLSTSYTNGSSSEISGHKHELSLPEGHINPLKKATNATYAPPVLTSQSIEGVEKFVFFIGYSRSGHSIVASMIDAHPNAVLAHEFDVFQRLATGKDYLLNKSRLFNALYQDSYTEAIAGWRSENSTFKRKGYSLKLNTSESWHGKFRTLKVIGDKAGGHTSHVYRDQPDVFQRVYRSLVDVIRVPVRVIHVVRNPYDIIATRVLYQVARMNGERGQKAQVNSTIKLQHDHVIKDAFNALYSEIRVVHTMIKTCNLTVIEIHNADFVQDPRKEMKSLCEFLGLSCSENYLKMCEQAAYKNVSKTRDAVEWPEEIRILVDTDIIRQFSSFKRYSLTGL